MKKIWKDSWSQMLGVEVITAAILGLAYLLFIVGVQLKYGGTCNAGLFNPETHPCSRQEYLELYKEVIHAVSYSLIIGPFKFILAAYNAIIIILYILRDTKAVKKNGNPQKPGQAPQAKQN